MVPGLEGCIRKHEVKRSICFWIIRDPWPWGLETVKAPEVHTSVAADAFDGNLPAVLDLERLSPELKTWSS